MHNFTIDSDIRKAETLPSIFYTDKRNFERSKDKIFARSWQLVCATDEIEKLKPQIILPDFLDEPVLITKNSAGFNCLSNVCTHRGNILIDDPCDATGIRCRYHGRRFDLNGKFLSMPEFEDVANFPSSKDDLTKIPFGIWKNFIFASIDPIAPLKEFVGVINEKLENFDFENLKFESAKDYRVAAHWALYCENYLEGFHIPFVHQGLNDALDYGSYATETFSYSSLQTGFDPEGNVAAQYFFIFPNLMFNFYPWGLSINIVKPEKRDRTTVSYLTFVNDRSNPKQGAGADLHTVELEDQKVVEAVQKGINSRFYDKGRYSPSKEKGTHHFHQLIAKFMNR
ncbi:MAG: Rieske 2Fe-2S domain-containing protein [Pyrinomonadaceae bacterium]|nr:Rieske 2Fe-2S domain-containing protein [Pyrinomonadaceae bacterium]